ncbi:MAG: hypothetical protein ABJH04_03385 [Cyclobacteriaceae bacterium]
MRSAYNETWLYNLEVIKETKRWLKAGFIEKVQFNVIAEAHSSSFYHPNFIIRLLIFVATLMGLSGVTGLFALMILDTNQIIISIGCLIYGIGSFVFVDQAIIKNSKHYKSGLTEALIYHACGFTIGGFAGLVDFETASVLLFSIIVLSFSAYRYLDLLTTVAAFFTLAYLVFFQLYEFGSIFQQIIPFAFILIFVPVYLVCKKWKSKDHLAIWNNNLIVIESLSLLLIYLAGNYLVVRELSVNLMGFPLVEGEDIPFAFLFYGLTLLIPVAYLYLGINNKDIVILRTSLLVLAFSIFTFKFYYGFEHLEITLTVLGIILLGIALLLFNYLKTIRNGFTRENLISEKWSSMNAEAFIISQTLGGNQVKVNDSFQGKGGEFGGGGSSGSF